ncbi:hypothetical protein BDW75DRAFT_225471 [Aspergillus navahoensis]
MLYPGLSEKEQWRSWPMRIQNYRQFFLDSKLIPVTKDNVAKASQIAKHCWKGGYAESLRCENPSRL